MRDGRAHCAYRESDTMGEIDLKQFEGTPSSKLTHDARTAISDAYLRYFDTLPPRERALGYFVVYAGISPTRIGLLDIGFKPKGDSPANALDYMLFMESAELHLTDHRLEGVLWAHVENDERIMRIMRDDDYQFPTDTWTRFPVFAPVYHGKTERLHDCRTFIANAGKAIGFNAHGIAVYKLRQTPYFTAPLINIDALMRQWAGTIGAQRVRVTHTEADGSQKVVIDIKRNKD